MRYLRNFCFGVFVAIGFSAGCGAPGEPGRGESALVNNPCALIDCMPGFTCERRGQDGVCVPEAPNPCAAILCIEGTECVVRGNKGFCQPTRGVCPADSCGPALGMPNYLCDDGVTVAGPTGRCLRGGAGGCSWEVVECPAP